MGPAEFKQIRCRFTPNYPWVAIDALVNGDLVAFDDATISMMERNHYDDASRQMNKACKDAGLTIFMQRMYLDSGGYAYTEGHAPDWFENSGVGAWEA